MHLGALSIAFWLLIRASNALIQEQSFPKNKIIIKDIAIIGGGASGTHASVRLRFVRFGYEVHLSLRFFTTSRQETKYHEDLNTSIILIEKKDHLGGHVDTYTVPETNTTLEFGVQSYIRYGGAEAYFARFDIEIAANAGRRLTRVNVDITNGKALTGYTPPSVNSTNEAFRKWLEIVEKYESLMEPGFWNFPTGDAIPSDLLTPFGNFARKHSLEAAAPQIMVISNVGLGGIEDVLTLYVMRAFGGPITRGLLANDLFVPVGSNSLLYQKVYELLREDVLLSSYVVEAERTGNGVKLVVQTPHGKVLVKAKRLLFTPPPSLSPSLTNFDTDKEEKEVFGTWKPTWSFVGVAKIPCIPENYSIAYVSPEVVPDNHLALRSYPYTLRFDSTGPNGLGLFRVLFGTNFTITKDEAKQTISENLQKIVAAGSINYTGDCKLEYRAFSNHNSILWRQTVEQLKAGFVQKMTALQGHRSTWYTGALWAEDYSSNTWAFTESALPKLLGSLKSSH